MEEGAKGKEATKRKRKSEKGIKTKKEIARKRNMKE